MCVCVVALLLLAFVMMFLILCLFHRSFVSGYLQCYHLRTGTRSFEKWAQVR